MSLLVDISERLDDCVVAAWVDARTGSVIDQHTARAGVFVDNALGAAAEVMRSRERPPRMVLLAERHVHIVQRARDGHRVLVVVCDRAANLGLAVSMVRAMLEAEGA